MWRGAAAAEAEAVGSGVLRPRVGKLEKAVEKHKEDKHEEDKGEQQQERKQEEGKGKIMVMISIHIVVQFKMRYD